MEKYFGEIQNGIMVLNDFGKIANDLWAGLPKTFDKILLDIHIIMPNHLHGIIAITEDITDSHVGNATKKFDKSKHVGDAYPEIGNPVGNATMQKSKTSKPSFFRKEFLNSQNIAELHSLQYPGYKRTKMYLSKIIQAYKAEVTRKIKRISKYDIKSSVWQKSFYDRIIRSEKEFNSIQQYIYENPDRWSSDKGNNDILISDMEYYGEIFN